MNSFNIKYRQNKEGVIIPSLNMNKEDVQKIVQIALPIETVGVKDEVIKEKPKRKRKK